MFENKHKAYEAEGPKVSVRVCASKSPGFGVAHLGGMFSYDRARGLEDQVKGGDMQHCSGYPFPADGKFHEYEFPQIFVDRLLIQAKEIPDQFEVEVIEAAPVIVAPVIVAPVAAPVAVAAAPVAVEAAPAKVGSFKAAAAA